MPLQNQATLSEEQLDESEEEEEIQELKVSNGTDNIK